MGDSRNKPAIDPVLEAVIDCLQRHVLPDQEVVVGFSGGLDSCVLLHALSQVAGYASFSALHVHHGLSPHADEWAAFCAATCDGWGIRFSAMHVKVSDASGVGIEDAARKARHAALAAIGADWIMLAHHADDQAETLLHNLLRGAGVRGAAAMPEVGRNNLRPLLGLPRGVLANYATRHGLSWIEDESNRDIRYTRNYLRHEVFPVLRARFPRAGEQLAAAARRFGETQCLLDDLAAIDLDGHPPEFPLPLALLRSPSHLRAGNLLRSLLVRQDVKVPDEARLMELVRQIREAGPDRHPSIDLPTYSLRCDKGFLHFQRHID